MGVIDGDDPGREWSPVIEGALERCVIGEGVRVRLGGWGRYMFKGMYVDAAEVLTSCGSCSMYGGGKPKSGECGGEDGPGGGRMKGPLDEPARLRRAVPPALSAVVLPLRDRGCIEVDRLWSRAKLQLIDRR